MATQDEIQSLYDRIAALRETVTSRLSSSLVQNPQLADVIVKQIDDLLASAETEEAKGPYGTWSRTSWCATSTSGSRPRRGSAWA